MKKTTGTHPIARGILLLLTFIFLATGLTGTLFVLTHHESVNPDATYYQTEHYAQTVDLYTESMEFYVQLQWEQDNGTGLAYNQRERLSSLQGELDSAQSNFRYRMVTSDTGEVIYTNLDTTSQDFDGSVYSVVNEEISLTVDSPLNLYQSDVQSTVDPWVEIALGEDSILVTEENATDGELYGWFWEEDGFVYQKTLDSRIVPKQTFILEYGVLNPIVKMDDFMTGSTAYRNVQTYMPLVIIATLTLDLLAFLFLVMCCATGRRDEEGNLKLNPFDRIPTDVVLVAAGCLGVGAGILFLELGNNANYLMDVMYFACLAGFGLGCALCLQIFLITFVKRIRAKTFLTNTIIWWALRGIYRFFRNMISDWPMVWRVVLGFVLYLIGSLITRILLPLSPFYQGLVLLLLCRWVKQWRSIRTGTNEIVGGSPDHKIDTNNMYPDLREHAQSLNNLGDAIGSAVDERLRSERFKSELITNVSHDLKTPLTSIINYVDLLKKEEIQNEKAVEYIEVLDRKSQRLKKLTEDLQEASKAAAGTLTVTPDKMSMVQLVQQAMGEYEEKFATQNLTMIPKLPAEGCYVHADGRHMWRILDNLLGNCHKYAMAGTRIYLDLKEWEGQVIFSIKNISQNELNMSSDQLMERFVRGDESRTTEGSGLGLSIARSLTDLQGGTLRLDIDGDLFKATIAFPAVSGGLHTPPPS